MLSNTRRISFLNKMLADRATLLFECQVGSLPLTAAQSRVVMYLESRDGGPVSQKELECYLGVTHTTAKGLLQRLEEKGLVRTAFDSEDGRVKNAYLTEQCIKLHDALQVHIDHVENQLLRGFSDEERRLAYSFLQRMCDNAQ